MQAKSESTSRRALLKGATATAAVAALAAPALAGGPDPVFAAIEAHRRAWGQLSEAIRNADRAFHEHGVGEQYEAAEGVASTKCRAVSDVERELVNTEPATLAGAVAMLRYLRQDDRVFLAAENGPALLKSLEGFLATKIA